MTTSNFQNILNLNFGDGTIVTLLLIKLHQSHFQCMANFIVLILNNLTDE
jgi:hypothetical protein